MNAAARADEQGVDPCEIEAEIELGLYPAERGDTRPLGVRSYYWTAREMFRADHATAVAIACHALGVAYGELIVGGVRPPVKWGVA